MKSQKREKTLKLLDKLSEAVSEIEAKDGISVFLYYTLDEEPGWHVRGACDAEDMAELLIGIEENCPAAKALADEWKENNVIVEKTWH